VHHRLGVGDVRHGTTQASASNRFWWRAHPQRSLSLAGQLRYARCPSHLVLSALALMAQMPVYRFPCDDEIVRRSREIGRP
jgi:hypothetical protein